MNIVFVHLGREHLGIEYLSAVVKQAGHRTALAYDPGIFGTEDNVFHIQALQKVFSRRREVLASIEREKPDLVAFSVYTSTYHWACGVARDIKDKLNIPVVFGGIHATLVPEEIMKNDFVDFVVAGEGEHALVELAGVLSKVGRPFDKRDYENRDYYCELDYSSVPNLWYRKEGIVVNNELAPFVEDLDGLPLPDKSLFESEVNYEDDYLIMAGRGCAYSCSYCCEHYINKLYGSRYYRKRSVDSILQELTAMQKRYRFREVMFNDALFFTDRVWLEELLGRFKREIGVPFRCFGKVNLLDEELARMLKDSGCYCIEFGMQTVNEEVKRTVLNRTETNSRALEAFKACDRAGLRYDIDHMFGLPGESQQDHIEGALFYSRLRYLNRIKVHNLTYFPRMPVIESALSHGLLDSEDVAAIEAGDTGNFFHGEAVENEWMQKVNRNFSMFYKFLPLLGESATGFIVYKKLYRLFGSIPKPVTIFLQIVGAIKGRDYRFFLYIKYYLLRIKRKLLS